MPSLVKHPAYFTYDPEARAYYFAPANRTAPPYHDQRKATVLLDIASDGTLAGIEFILGDALEEITAPRQHGDILPPKGTE